MDRVTESILEEATEVQLVELHNLVPGVRPATRLGDRSTAKARVRLALERAGCKAARIEGRPSVYRVVPQDAESDLRGPGALRRRIRLLVTENPKRPTGRSHARFALYRDGMTMEEYIDAAVATGVSRERARRDIYHDREHGFIETCE